MGHRLTPLFSHARQASDPELGNAGPGCVEISWASGVGVAQWERSEGVRSKCFADGSRAMGSCPWCSVDARFNEALEVCQVAPGLRLEFPLEDKADDLVEHSFEGKVLFGRVARPSGRNGADARG